jgi:hypothetical protein
MTAGIRSFVTAAGLAALAGLMTGCPSMDPRTSNQGGGNILTAGAKIAAGRISTLTPDEVQILGDTVSANSPQVEIWITDEQAADAVQFLKDNNVNTIQDIQRLVEQYRRDPDSIEIPQSIVDLFESGGFETST